jgi:hypothetical protein
MKYCEDDIIKARNILSHMKSSTNDLKTFYLMIKLNEDELVDVVNGIDTLINIIEYGENLRDDKLNKLFKMKKIIKGE